MQLSLLNIFFAWMILYVQYVYLSAQLTRCRHQPFQPYPHPFLTSNWGEQHPNPNQLRQVVLD
jgi:hypothetical protein